MYFQLGEEPQLGEDGVITIALRTPDSRMHRRRFAVSDFVKVSSKTHFVAIFMAYMDA